MLKLSHTFLWVTDQDAARDFYVDKLGFEVREDSMLGDFRWLTVGPPSQPDLEIVLLLPGPPPLDPETAEQVKALVARGAGSGLIFAVDDCRATIERLRERGVDITQEPVEQFYGVDAGIRDPSGNSIRITQPAPVPAG
jgi:catechol 2,3-dioxygenase-like lactoylglutathione lyase family enzyme